MLRRIADSVGALPDVMTKDAGYWSEDNAKARMVGKRRSKQGSKIYAQR
jgi:hypothetical protein